MEEKSLSRPISFAADIDFLLSNPPPRADRQSRNSDSVLVPVIHRICESTDFFSFKDGNTLQNNQYKEKFNIFLIIAYSQSRQHYCYLSFHWVDTLHGVMC